MSRPRPLLLRAAAVLALGGLLAACSSTSDGDPTSTPAGSSASEPSSAVAGIVVPEEEATMLADMFDDPAAIKEIGPPSTPGKEAIEIAAGVGYVARTAGDQLHLEAYDTTTGEQRWKHGFEMNAQVVGAAVIAAGGLVAVRVKYAEYADLTMFLDPETGEEAWYRDGNSPKFFGDRVIWYDEGADASNAIDLATGEELWTLPSDGGRTSWHPPQTADTLTLPWDIGDEAHLTIGVGRDPDLSYVVQAAFYSGRTQVVELASGSVLAEENLGDKIHDVEVYEDTIVVYRNTPQELAAYSSDTLEPAWQVEVPAADDGSLIGICAVDLVCLRQVHGQESTVLAVDRATGEVRWESDDLASTEVPRAAGDLVAVSSASRGTLLLDPADGTVVHEFADPAHAMVGDGVVLASDAGVLWAASGHDEPVELGSLPTPGLLDGSCEWGDTHLVCADEAVDGFTVWRYRS